MDKKFHTCSAVYLRVDGVEKRLDKPSLANDTSTGNACERKCQKPKDEFQTRPESTSTFFQLPGISAPPP